MSDRPGDPEDDDFREAQEGDYEPEPIVRDSDDLPADESDEDDDRILPDDDRPVPLDPDDAEIA